MDATLSGRNNAEGEKDVNPSLLSGAGGDAGGGEDGVSQVPQHALNILPEELWMHIFYYLKDDPKALKSLSNTCRSFHRILEAMKPPSQLELLKGRLLYKVKYWIWSLKNIRTLTLESQQQLARAIGDAQGLISVNNWLINKLSIRLLANIPDFECNNFLSGCWGLLPFLQNVGVLNIDLISGMLESYVEHYDIVRMVLQALPNIEEVKICAFVALVDSTELEKDRVLAFNEHVNLYPLPSAPKLRTLNFRGGQSVPLAYLIEIGKRYGTSLKMLQINHSDYLEEATVLPQQPVSFSQLETLELNLSFRNHKPALLIKAPTLASLSLYFYGTSMNIQPQDMVAPPLEQVFQVLDHYQGVTAVSLDLEIHRRMDHSEIMQRYLGKRYSSVKYFWLGRWGYRVPLSFFAGIFPYLEYMHVGAQSADYISVHNCSQEDPDLQLILKESFEKSQLWRSLPRLKGVSTMHAYGPTHASLCYGRLCKTIYYSRPEEMGGGQKQLSSGENRARQWMNTLITCLLVMAVIVSMLFALGIIEITYNKE